MSLIMDTDHHSRDSGVASSSTLNRHMPVTNSGMMLNNEGGYLTYEEMPTDLSTSHANPYQQQQQQSQMYANYTSNRHGSPVQYGTTPEQQQQFELPAAPPQHSPPTINQVLLEAAAIRHRELPNLNREEDVTQAALQIMQLSRSTATDASQPPPQMHMPSGYQPYPHHVMLESEHQNYDDTHEANQLIDHYKRGELARHGIHKGYAPVPKFE